MLHLNKVPTIPPHKASYSSESQGPYLQVGVLVLQTGKPPVGSPLVEFGLKRVYLSLGIYRLSQFPRENTPALRAPNPAV